MSEPDSTLLWILPTNVEQAIAEVDYLCGRFGYTAIIDAMRRELAEDLQSPCGGGLTKEAAERKVYCCPYCNTDMRTGKGEIASES